jgi:pSer/pThr/pTyr-binding forkhead associated (FHA) protein
MVAFRRDYITLGRADGNMLRLTERNVSRRHACFRRSSEGVFIEDLDSANGVRINGERVKGKAELQLNDLIEIGQYQLLLCEGDGNETKVG